MTKRFQKTFHSTYRLVMAIIALLADTPIVTYAYEEMELSDGGSLEGSVNLIGQIPKPKGYNLVTFPDPVYCGRISNGSGWRLLQPFDVGPKGEFRQVVVMVVGIDKGKAFPSHDV